jgi:hypothetical protein
MGSYSDLMRMTTQRQWEFSAATQPKIEMKIVSKIERIQPTCVGTDERGEPIWEGRPMARWQMELLRVAVNWYGTFFTRWLEVTKYESKAEDFRPTDGMLTEWLRASRERLDEIRGMYPPKKKYNRQIQGD